MTVATIVEEINKLPLTEKLLILEKTLSVIRQESLHLDISVNSLYNDYKTDKDLTLFTQLDSEPFYETR